MNLSKSTVYYFEWLSYVYKKKKNRERLIISTDAFYQVPYRSILDYDWILNLSLMSRIMSLWIFLRIGQIFFPGSIKKKGKKISGSTGNRCLRTSMHVQLLCNGNRLRIFFSRVICFNVFFVFFFNTLNKKMTEMASFKYRGNYSCLIYAFIFSVETR